MNWDIVEGKWREMKGSVQAQWGKLTDDDIDEIEGNREKLAGKIQAEYRRPAVSGQPRRRAVAARRFFLNRAQRKAASHGNEPNDAALCSCNRPCGETV